MNCIPIEQLVAWTQNRLPAREAESIRAHLGTGCGACRKQVVQLQKVLAAIANHGLVEPSDWLIQQAKNLFAWHKTNPGENRLEQIPAILLVDSFAAGLLPGFRGAGPMTRQMLYRAGEYDIDVSIDYVEPAQAIDIMGQAMPLRADFGSVVGADVKLLNASCAAFGTKTNEFGEFILDGVPEGIYDLKIQLKDQELGIVGLRAVSQPE